MIESDYVTPPITRIAYDLNQNIEYIGKAAAGSDVAVGVWQITKLEYDANQNIESIVFASGTQLFDKMWSIRDTYTYS